MFRLHWLRIPQTLGRVAVIGAMLAITPVLSLTAGCQQKKTAQDYMAAGDKAVREKNTDAAVQNYTEAVKLDRKSIAAHLALAAIFAGRSQFGLAEEQYRAAVALDPSNPGARLGLASVLQASDKPGEAESELRTAIGLAPENAQAHFALAKLLDKASGRQAEAQEEYGRASAIDPTLVRPAAPAEVAPAVAAPAPTPAVVPKPTTVKIKPVDKMFKLTHNSPVYESPDSTSRTVGQVRRRKYVHVVGISGEWFQVKLRDGTVGFIPISAAE